jgi:1-acyl-sn-glycerol-3-phosphate acyltransferase
MLRLFAAGMMPQARRLRSTLGALAYAGWWWTVLIGCALVAYPGVLLLPRLDWRWALLRGVARAALWLMHIRLDVIGAWPAVRRPLIVTNHTSYFDSLVLLTVLPGEPVFVAKQELNAQIVAGPFLRALGALFVNRADPEGGVEDTQGTGSRQGRPGTGLLPGRHLHAGARPAAVPARRLHRRGAARAVRGAAGTARYAVRAAWRAMVAAAA